MVKLIIIKQPAMGSAILFSAAGKLKNIPPMNAIRLAWRKSGRDAYLSAQ
jgi:hypothetical protein